MIKRTEESNSKNTLLELPIVGEVPSPFERVFDGPMTEEMLLEPAKFGLGMVPNRKQPTATTNMVCGFCSTGCSLNVHLHEGEAINLTPTTDYPVNTGMACPKGWEALAPLRSKDRGTKPLLKNKKGSHPSKPNTVRSRSRFWAPAKCRTRN